VREGFSNLVHLLASDLTLEPLSRGMVDPVSLDNVKVEKDAGPGVFYNNLGFQTKGEAEQAIVEDAQDVLKSFVKGVKVAPRYFKAGGRARLVSPTSVSVKRGRMIQAQDGRDLRLCQMLFQPLTTLFAEESKYCALGRTHFFGAPLGFVQRFKGCKWVVGFDISGMDASVDLTSSAAFILNALVGGVNVCTTHKIFVLNTILKRALVMPDGVTYLMENGLASGHAGTSLIETLLVVYLMLGTIAEILLEKGFSIEAARHFITTQVEYEELGDDGLLGVRNEAIHWHEIHQRFELHFAGSIAPEKTSLVFYKRGFQVGDNLPQYLGKKYEWVQEQRVEVTRPFFESASILLWPERPVSTVQHSFDRACGILLDNPHDKQWQAFCRAYIDWLLEQYDVVEGTAWDPEVAKGILFIWSGVELPLPFTSYLSIERLELLYSLRES